MHENRSRSKKQEQDHKIETQIKRNYCVRFPVGIIERERKEGRTVVIQYNKGHEDGATIFHINYKCLMVVELLLS